MPVIEPSTLGQQIAQNLPDKPKVHDSQRVFELILEGIQARDYGKTLQWAACYRDFFYGIQTRFMSLADGSPVIVRDAREANGYAPDDYDPRALQITAINYTRAAQELLGKSIPDSLNLELSATLRAAIINLNDPLNEAKTEIGRYTTYLLELLAQELNISLDEAKKRLLLAKDFVNLKESTAHIVTVSRHVESPKKSKTLIEIDSPLCDITPELAQEYKDYDKQLWYQKMEPWEQRLTCVAVQRMREGNRIVPTQLRKHLPGLRMAYLSSYGYIEKKEFHLVGENFNNATLIFRSKSKACNARIVDMHVDQTFAHIKSHQTDAQKLMFVSLNAKHIPHAGENVIVSETKRAVTKKHLHANLCLNDFRFLTPNTYQAIETQLQEVVNLPQLSKLKGQIKADTDAIRQFISTDKKQLFPNATKLVGTTVEEQYAEVLALLNKYKSKYKNKKTPANDHIYPLLYSALICSRDLKLNAKSLRDPENRNLNIAVHSIHINQRLHPLCDNKPFATIANGCQSNKDRGGILVFFLKCLGFSFMQDGSEQHTASFAKTLAGSGHIQFRAGWQGGTIGAFSIKKSAAGVLPNSLDKEVAKALMHDESKLNSSLIQKTPEFSTMDEGLINLLAGLRIRIHKTKAKYDFQHSGIFHSIWHMLFSNSKISEQRVKLLNVTLNTIDTEISQQPNQAQYILDKLKDLKEQNKTVAKSVGGALWFFHGQGGTQKYLKEAVKNLQKMEESKSATPKV